MKTSDIFLFEERQHFRQWWHWLIIGAVNGLFLFGVWKQVINHEQFGDKPMSDAGLLAMAVISLICSAMLYRLRLETRISKEALNVRFYPFQLKYRCYPWSQMSKYYIRQYNPITEYGGWGIRLGIFGKGKALNVSGNKGLQLEFSNGKKLLIGTNKPDQLQEVLEKIKEGKP
jgi:hypothetical protein